MILLPWSSQGAGATGHKKTTHSSTSARKKGTASKSRASKGAASHTAASKRRPSKGASSHRAASKSAPGTRSKTTASRRGRKSSVKSTTWRNRQTSPTPERYKEIQEALAAKGYLKQEDATGAWNGASIEALKRFQAEQKLDANGKINALSLIALGLGPKHETAALKPPAQAPAPQLP
jgi:hypothetical protein